ncbi:MAG: methylglutaconyl-CoA hydratase, partial [Marivirga sp.]|nr:methylglutaconyl-CoA hydratase [Marivirga sp.]
MKTILYNIRDNVGIITLNRPEKRNALNLELVTELKSAFSMMEADDQVKVIILNANGPAFCAGADLEYLQQLQKFSYEENLSDSNRLKDLFFQIYTLKKVVIAQVQGHAVAGGCGLATVCDFIFAVPDAKFGYTEVKIGFVPAIVMVFLLRKIGEAKVKELLLGGELVSAEDAHLLGMVNKIMAKEDLDSGVMDFAQNLLKTNSSQSMTIT